MLNVPEDTLDKSLMNEINQGVLKQAKGFALDDLDANISVIPNRVCKVDNQTMNYRNGFLLIGGLAISRMASKKI